MSYGVDWYCDACSWANLDVRKSCRNCGQPRRPEQVSQAADQAGAQAIAIAKTIDEFLNGSAAPEEKRGFAVMIFDFNKIEAGRMNWISNAQRADMIVALKEMIAQLEGRASQAGHA